jgi:4-carboxymuconolactone decarboxylase
MTVDVTNFGRLVSPALGGVLDMLGQSLHSDGALSAADKSVSVAMGHAAVEQPEFVRRELARAADLGVPEEHILGASTILLHVRGGVVFREFVLAARPTYALSGVTMLDTPPPGLDAAVAYLTEQAGGELPARSRLLADEAPMIFEAYASMHRIALGDSSIDPCKRELSLCTVLAAVLQFGLLESHVGGARRQGASEAQIVEAIMCAVPAAGGLAWAGGSAAVLRTRDA